MRRIFKAVLTAIWFMVLTLPVMGIKLNTLDQTVQWRFDRILWLVPFESSFGSIGMTWSAKYMLVPRRIASLSIALFPLT